MERGYNLQKNLCSFESLIAFLIAIYKIRYEWQIYLNDQLFKNQLLYMFIYASERLNRVMYIIFCNLDYSENSIICPARDQRVDG